MLVNKSLDELVIVTIKNISDFDFTPELGAMFGGRPFFVKTGETLQAPEPAGYRLAVNLAKAMLNKKVPVGEAGKGDDRSSLGVYSSDDVLRLVAEIIVDSTREEKKPVLSEADRIAEKIAELNKLKEELLDIKSGLTAPEPSSSTVKTSSAFNDKAEVIAELEKKGVKFDKRQSKSNLEKLLSETA